MKNKSILSIWIFAIFFSLIIHTILSYAMSEYSQKSFFLVRIAIIDDTDEVELYIPKEFKISALYTDETLEEGDYLKKVEVRPAYFGIVFGDRKFKIFGIYIKTRSGYIYLNSKRFRGDIVIIRKSNMKLLVVNYLDIEEYLRGVIPSEVAWWWPMETLKAQAIVARSFAIYQAQKSYTKDYDLKSDIYSQVYTGKLSERWKTNLAVKLTKGKIITYKGNVLPAYYHATCGGHTEDASNLWDIELLPLKGVKCNFCKDSPHYYWEKVISLKHIEKKLVKAGYNINKLKSIEILERNASGRISQLNLKAGDRNITISGKDFRQIIGPNIIRSASFDVNVLGGNAEFKGYGWGHGVGLCQWGAYFMARQGYKAEEILKFYYPGIEIGNVRSVNTINSVETTKTDKTD